MSRAAIAVIASSLLFAMLGLAAGYLCVSTYQGQVVLDPTGKAVRVSSGHDPRPEFVIGCYLGPPLVGAVMGFGLVSAAIKGFGGRESR